MTTAVSLDLSPDAPHTPQRTAELAGRLAEIVRVLGEATKDGAVDGADGPDTDRPAPGIGWPVAPEDLLDRLARLAEGTEELYPRLADALGRHQEAGTWRVAPVTGYARDLDEDLATVAEHLNEAAALAADVARHLYQARNLLSCVRPNYPRTDGAAPRAASQEQGSEPEQGQEQGSQPQQEQSQDREPDRQRESDRELDRDREQPAEAEVSATPAPSAPASPASASLSAEATSAASVVAPGAPVRPRPPAFARAPHTAVISSGSTAAAQAVAASAHE
jgi:hypothetical protein